MKGSSALRGVGGLSSMLRSSSFDAGLANSPSDASTFGRMVTRSQPHRPRGASHAARSTFLLP
jgi:hypothetical protein